MESKQFDRLARASVNEPTRRTLVRGLAAALTGVGVIGTIDQDAEAGKSKAKKRKERQRKQDKRQEKRKDQNFECDYKDRLCATPTHPCMAVACVDHKCVTSTLSNGTSCGLGRQCDAGACACPGGVCNATVTPSNMDGWALYNERTNQPIPATFAIGPGTPPVGTGSAALETGPGANEDKQMLSVRMLNGTRLDELTELTYSTYVHSSTYNSAPHFQIGITRDLNDPKDFYEGRVVYSPGLGDVVPGQWQEWDPINDTNKRFFVSPGDYPPVTLCTQSSRCTFTEVLQNYPGIAINPIGPSPENSGSGWGFVGVMVGSGEGIVDANFDAVTIAVPGSQYNFNFEPNS